MLDPILLAALVALVKRLVEVYLPDFPISEELLNAVIVFLLGLFGSHVFKAGAQKFAPALFSRGLLKE